MGDKENVNFNSEEIEYQYPRNLTLFTKFVSIKLEPNTFSESGNRINWIMKLKNHSIAYTCQMQRILWIEKLFQK